MNQLTIRGFDPPLERHLRETAERYNLSLNKAALLLMRRGAGLLEETSPRTVGSSIDHLIGSWSADDEVEFQAAAKDFNRLDEDLWP